jgi:2-polyprenyl-3-methyl-5-hydroxy-6-metoxy-1,4-benzoquinol methylase
MKNPIIKELVRLKLISKPNLITLSNKTRDKRVKVKKDLKTNIIFLEKCLTSDKYYSSLTHRNENKIKIKLKKNVVNNKIFYNNIHIPIFDDDLRRAILFKKYIKNKNILDFGCGWGGFLKNLRNYRSLNGIELRKDCINYIQNNIKKINISNDINSFEQKFDVITMFHVLEHIPKQIKLLKILKSKLKKKGKIIIEVPHAEDFLILQDDLKEFKNFTFWSEHLILHTLKSLKTFLLKADFKNIKVEYYQRYNLSNHLYWFLKRKPGGHYLYKKSISDKVNLSYCKNLKKLRQTDTLIAIAE